MKLGRIASVVMATVLAMTLAACGGASSYSQESLEDAKGIKVTAENAGSDSGAYTESAITVEDGDVIVISPCMDKGSFHLTIVSDDDDSTLYDEDVDGRVFFTIEAEPGTYSVKTSGNKATGWMTVFAESSEELAEQDASLAEALEDAKAETEEQGN